MVKCPSCGNSGWFMKRVECSICHKLGCDKCMIFLLDIFVESHVLEKWHLCSDQCWETFAKKIEEKVTPDRVYIPSGRVRLLDREPVFKFIDLAIRSSENRSWISRKFSTYLAESKSFSFAKYNYGKLDWKLWKRISKTIRLVKAENLQKAGRFEEAAQIYEHYKMYNEAGKARVKSREIKVIRTDVSIDLNSLLQQAKDGELIIEYRCPSCGGNIRINGDTKAEYLKKCEYCGTLIETLDLIEYIKSALLKNLKS